MSPLVRVAEEQVGDVTVVAIDGEIDASNARDVGERLRSALTNHSHALVVDLGQTTYIDSAGINVLFALDLELRQRRQHLHLVVRPASPIARMTGITGLDRAVATHPERDAALAAAVAP
jgi:anti-sigma B factor antagonist